MDKELSLQTMTDVINQPGQRNYENALSDKDLQNPTIKKKLAVIRDIEAMPKTWEKGRDAWFQVIALRYGVGKRTVWEWSKRYEKNGFGAFQHNKPYKNKPRVWSREALDFWISLCAKREHRKINRKDLYPLLAVEASRQGWQIGGLKSANWWFNKLWNPCLDAMQRGGLRALDNIMPPILRDYSDLQPFQILVGDQHRFDFWVVDEETGEVYRPEAYLWQDLRTRVIYGAAIDKKYDAWLIGLALRIGVSLFGAFHSFYTDNGRPELSRFVTSILANLNAHGMNWEKTDELLTDPLDVDAENISPYCTLPGTHRKAIIKNAKAKMIEGTFDKVEDIMASVMRLPGSTKRMSDDIHWQDIDQQEAKRLAEKGKLLANREFALAMYQACDYYNKNKSHRGVLAEWSSIPKPAQATPYDCLRACYENGWRPRMISNEAADLLFLARDSRVINKGMLSLNNEFYVHDALIELHKKRVDIRFNPMVFSEVHVFLNERYICTALPVERSSMIDSELASRKIAEKRERRRKFAEEFKKISSIAPDFRQYSTVPESERVAALIGAERKKRALENQELNRVMTQEELDEGVRYLEHLNNLPSPKKILEVQPRPKYWMSESERFEWCLRASLAGAISIEDANWMSDYENAMNSEDQQYTKRHREFLQEDYDQVVMVG